MDILWVYEFPLWASAVFFVIVLTLALESGFRIGLRKHRASKDAEKTVRGDVTLGSMLALLGLVLAFTYAFTLSRADMRKQAIIAEANAIGTAFLRADLAAEPGRSELRERLLEYARTRVATLDVVDSRDAFRQFLARSLEVQSTLWPTTKRALQGDVPVPLQVSIVQAVNEVLDAHTIRLAVVFDRIPAIVFITLVLIAAASLAVAAHNAGLNGRMSRLRMGAFALVLAALMLIIMDFDRPLAGFIQTDQGSLFSMIRDMENAMAE